MLKAAVLSKKKGCRFFCRQEVFDNEGPLFRMGREIGKEPDHVLGPF
jgi:hypothetical protein